MNSVSKYRMFVQARTDLTKAEIERHVKSATAKGGPRANFLPWREGDVIHARRSRVACIFYRELKQIAPVIWIKAVRINEVRPPRRYGNIQIRGWIGFACLSGAINGVEDEIKHFGVLSDGMTACGIRFQEHWHVNGKPECDKCLAAAVERHPEMKEFL